MFRARAAHVWVSQRKLALLIANEKVLRHTGVCTYMAEKKHRPLQRAGKIPRLIISHALNLLKAWTACDR